MMNESSGEDLANPDQRQDIFSSSPIQCTASGLRKTLHGVIYQIKLQMLFLFRGYTKGYKFRLATEMDLADKFDDVVFQYENKAECKIVHRFLQAKHKANESKMITAKNLMTDSNGDFSLPKYFRSYIKIKKNPNFSSDHLQDFIICTNINFNERSLREKNIKTIKITEPDPILQMETSKNKPAALYKLYVDENSEIYKYLKNTSELNRLAKELAKHISKGQTLTLQNELIKLHRSQLVAKVFDINQNDEGSIFLTFRERFLEGSEELSTGTKSFRVMFMDCLKLNEEGFKKNLSLKKVPVDQPLGERLKIEHNPVDTDFIIDEIKDEDIKDFFSKLVFAVNQPNEKELQEILTKEIARYKQCNLQKAEIVTKIFQVHMLDWLKEKEKGFLTNEDGKAFFEEIKKQLNVLNCEGLSLVYPMELQSYAIKFSNDNQEVRKFLDDENIPVLYIITSEQSLLNVIRIYHTLSKDHGVYKKENCRFFSLKTLLLSPVQKHVLDEFKSSENYCLLIIDCTSRDNLEEEIEIFIRKLCSEIKKHNQKKLNKIIFISKNSLTECFKKELPEEYYQEVKDRLINFKDLTTDSQSHLLEKKVDFLGEKTSLNKLIDLSDENSKEIIDSRTVVRLIRNEQVTIGSPPPGQLMPLDKICKEVPLINVIKTVLQESDDILMISGIEYPDIGTNKDKLIQLLGFTEENFEDRKEIALIKDQIVPLDEVKDGSNKRIILSQGDEKNDHFANFKSLCDQKPKKVIFWINKLGEKFVWEYLYNPQFYFKREFYLANFNKDIKNELIVTNPPQFFIFSGISELQELVDLLEISEPREENILSSNLNKFFELKQSEDDAKKCFRNKRDSEKAVHWLAVKENGQKQLIWRCSHGSLDVLRQNKVENNGMSHQASIFMEDEVVILADEPGMGKTTTITNLARINFLPRNWVIRVNFKDFVGAIKSLPEQQEQQQQEQQHQEQPLLTIDKVCNFLLRNADIDLEKRLLKCKLQQPREPQNRPVLVLFDGFDEIQSEDQDRVIQLLRFLKEKTSARIWITTRPYKMIELENSLSVFATRFVGFDKKTQLKFLEDFWKVRLKLLIGLEDEQEEDLRKYSKALLKKATDIFERKPRIMGIPLQLRLLAEGFQEDVKTFIEEGEKKVPQFKDYNIIDMYQRFIDARYQIYFKEKSQLNSEQDLIRRILTDSFNKAHQYLAFKMLFPEEKKLTDAIFAEHRNKKHQDDFNFLGIVQSRGREEIDFIHITFAEYFVATLFGYCLDLKETRPFMFDLMKAFLSKELFKDSNQLIREFLDCLLTKSSPFLNATLNGILYKRENLPDNSHTIVDNLGRTAVHFASQQGHIEIVRQLLHEGSVSPERFHRKYLQVTDKDVSKFKTTADMYSRSGIADSKNHKSDFEFLKFMVDGPYKHFSNSEPDLFRKKYLPESRPEAFRITSLLCSRSEPDVFLRTSFHDSRSEPDFFRRPFFFFTRSEPDVFHRTSLNYTRSEPDVFRRTSLNYRHTQPDVFRRTCLHYAARYGQAEVVHFLLESCQDIDIEKHIFKTPVLLDTEVGDNIFRKTQNSLSRLVYFVNMKDINGKTCLYYAAEQKHWNICCDLMLYGADCQVLTDEKKKEFALYIVSHQTRPFWGNLEHKQYPVLGLLSIKVPDAFSHFKESSYVGLLSIFFKFGHIKVIDAVLKTIKDENKRKKIAKSFTAMLIFIHEDFTWNDISAIEQYYEKNSIPVSFYVNQGSGYVISCVSTHA